MPSPESVPRHSDRQAPSQQTLARARCSRAVAGLIIFAPGPCSASSPAAASRPLLLLAGQWLRARRAVRFTRIMIRRVREMPRGRRPPPSRNSRSPAERPADLFPKTRAPLAPRGSGPPARQRQRGCAKSQ